MLLSIIIPTYNEAQNVESFVKAIESILEKDSYEIIFVDDNSKDNTVKIIRSFKKKNINLIQRKKVKGFKTRFRYLRLIFLRITF